MLDSTITALLGSAAVVVTVTALVLNGIFAVALGGTLTTTTADALQFLLFVALALNIASVIYLTFFAYISIRKINNRAASWSTKFRWRMLAIGLALCVIAWVVTAIPLIWLATRVHELPGKIVLQRSETMFILWFAVWGISVVLQTAVYFFIGRWTKAMARFNSNERLDLDFGIRVTPMDEARTSTYNTRRSYNSQDPTLASPPRTPTTPRTPLSSTRNSSATRIGPGSSRIKLIQKGSARSSLDFPAPETTSIDSAFDRWDTSSVHYEIRVALHSSPPVTRSGLETIPGSRPESPADALNESVLPDSPHAISSDTAIPSDSTEFIPSSPPRHMSSSPPSSPPNFSRPTSRDQNKPMLGPSMQDLIHPLFRPNSPRPPPIAVGSTMVTASPMAGYPITPRTLARMRSNTVPQHWRAASSVASCVSSPPGSPGSQGPGSPGPSIAEEDDLPPILPGFVLSAGQRSSLQWYSQRKSLKERPRSSHSQMSRRSSMR